MPALLNLYPPAWQLSPKSVYLSKLFPSHDKPSEAMEVGNVCEPGLVEWLSQKIRKPIERNVFCVHENGVMCANLDGRVDSATNVEAKWTSQPDEYGVEGTDQIAMHTIIQVHAAFAVTGASVCLLPVLLLNRVRMFRVERDDELVAMVEEACVEFWEKHVKPRIPPEGELSYEHAMRVVRRPFRELGEAIEISDADFEAVASADQAARDADKAKKKARAEVLFKMADFSRAIAPGGGEVRITRYSIREQVRAATEGQRITIRRPPK